MRTEQSSLLETKQLYGKNANSLTPANHHVNNLQIQVGCKYFLDLSLNAQSMEEKPAKLCHDTEVHEKSQEATEGLQRRKKSHEGGRICEAHATKLSTTCHTLHVTPGYG